MKEQKLVNKIVCQTALSALQRHSGRICCSLSVGDVPRHAQSPAHILWSNPSISTPVPGHALGQKMLKPGKKG